MIKISAFIFISYITIRSVAGMPLFVNIPLDSVNQEGELTHVDEFKSMLRKLQESKIDGIIVDIWWSVVEKNPEEYNFGPYIEILQLAKEHGLKVRFQFSFHDCGSTFNDTCNIKLPEWILEKRDEDIFYKDINGSVIESYISLFADNEELFGNDNKRTPIKMYDDFMNQFKNKFSEEFNKSIEGVIVGLGPSGQLRYPAYRNDKNSFCGVGSFQHFDKFALGYLKSYTSGYEKQNIEDNIFSNIKLLGHSNFVEYNGLEERPKYDSKPHETHVFKTFETTCNLHPLEKENMLEDTEEDCVSNGACWNNDADVKCFKKAVSFCQMVDNREDCGQVGTTESECTNKGCCWDESIPNVPYCFKSSKKETYQTPYGKIFLEWYENKLFKHGEQIIKAAREIFPKLLIYVKLPSVFWLVDDSSRAAELTSGFNTTKGSPYERIIVILKKYQIGLIFSGFGALNTEYDPTCKANPEFLVNEIKQLSKSSEVELTSEPTVLTRPDDAKYSIFEQQLDNLTSIIPFRAARGSEATISALDKFIERSNQDSGRQIYSRVIIKKVLIIIETNSCEGCTEDLLTNAII